MRYLIITATTPDDLQDQVIEKIEEGYTTTGGVSVTGLITKTFYQALVYNQSQPIYQTKESVPYKSKGKFA